MYTHHNTILIFYHSTNEVMTNYTMTNHIDLLFSIDKIITINYNIWF